MRLSITTSSERVGLKKFEKTRDPRVSSPLPCYISQILVYLCLTPSSGLVLVPDSWPPIPFSFRPVASARPRPFAQGTSSFQKWVLNQDAFDDLAVAQILGEDPVGSGSRC